MLVTQWCLKSPWLFIFLALRTMLVHRSSVVTHQPSWIITALWWHKAALSWLSESPFTRPISHQRCSCCGGVTHMPAVTVDRSKRSLEERRRMCSHASTAWCWYRSRQLRFPVQFWDCQQIWRLKSSFCFFPEVWISTSLQRGSVLHCVFLAQTYTLTM